MKKENKKYKILMLTQSTCKTGGSEDDFTRLLVKLKGNFEIISVFPEGYRVDLYKSLSDDYLIYPNRVFPLSGFNLKNYAAYFVYNFLKLFKLIPFLSKHRDADICFINSSVSFFDAFLLRLFSLKYVVSIKEKIYPDFIGNCVYRYFNNTAEKVFVISEYLKNEFKKITGSERAMIIHSSIESDYYDSIAGEYKIKNAEKNNRSSFTILNIGSIYEIKGTNSVLKAASHFERNDNVKFKIIGENVSPGYYDGLIKLYNELKLEGIVEFCGSMEKEKLIEEIINCDCILITSKTEGQSLVLLEAMLLEKPVITTSVGVIPEVIRNEENGLIFEYGDIMTIVNHVKRLKNDLAFYGKITKSLRSTFFNYFDLQKSLDKYETEMFEIIEKKS